MRIASLAALLLFALSGCGGDVAANDPKKLPPLTEADKQAIKAEDARVQEEEQGTVYNARKSAKTKSTKAYR